MTNPKPFVKLACLCERVQTEIDGVQTIVRVVDQFIVNPIPAKVLEIGATPQIQLLLVLGLSGTGITGKHDLGIQLFGPTKAEMPHHTSIEFPPGPLSTLNAVMNVQIGVVKNYGEGRFEITFDGEILTVVPFRLLEAPESSSPTAGEQPQS